MHIICIQNAFRHIEVYEEVLGMFHLRTVLCNSILVLVKHEMLRSKEHQEQQLNGSWDTASDAGKGKIFPRKKSMGSK